MRRIRGAMRRLVFAAAVAGALIALSAGSAPASPSKRCGKISRSYYAWAHNVSCSFARYYVARRKTASGFRCYTYRGSNVPFYCFGRGGPYPREGRQYWAAR